MSAHAARVPFTGTYVEQRFPFGEAPDVKDLRPGSFWAYIEDSKVVAVDFLCPCGCGHSCYTPVTDANQGQAKTERHWLYSSGPTLSPSIRYLGGCKAHFNITNGRAVMHGDSGK